MTVAELITRLQKYPSDTLVLYRACSDWNVLCDDEIEFFGVGDKRIARREVDVMGGIREYFHDCDTWTKEMYAKENKVPEYISAVLFPGN